MSFITDETLRKLMSQAGLNPDSVSQGVDMAVTQQLTPYQSYRQEVDQTYQSAQAAAPPINVRVKEVEPPVILKGTMELTITFPYDSLIGLPEEEVRNRIYRVIYGENDNGTWLPQVRYGTLDIWREVVRSEPRAGSRESDTAFSGTVRPIGGQDDSGHAGDHQHRDAGTPESGAGESGAG